MSESEEIKDSIFNNIRQDFPASIVVFFVALPLCLGIALASGASLFSGIIAGIVGGIVVGSISNSALGVSGPAAGLAVIVFNSIQSLGAFDIFLVAVIIAGGLQILMGLLRGGTIASYFPSAVIKGMLAGIGIIIFLKQIPHALGYDDNFGSVISFNQWNGENIFSELLKVLDYVSFGPVIVSVVSLLILITWDKVLADKHKIFKLVQGPVVAVTFGIVYQIITSQYFPSISIDAKHLVSVPVTNSLAEFSSLFNFPSFSHILSKEVWIIGFTIAIVASLETLLCVEATDKLDPLKRTTNTNRELIAQGAGNMISGFIGGLPITQVIVRSSANIQSGGKTKLSAIIHGIFLLIIVVSIPFVLNIIPLAVLASILLVVGYKLAKPSLFKQMYHIGWNQFLPFIVTIIGIVFTDLLIGIGMGVFVGLFIPLVKSANNSHFMHIEEVEDGQHNVTMTLAEQVMFLNKGAILKALNKLPRGTHLVINMSKSVFIDYDVLEIVVNFKNTSESKGIKTKLIHKEKIRTADY